MAAAGTDDAVQITVADDGPGLAADAAERVYRGDPSRTRSSVRSGLGSAITKAIVETHGGEISLTSTPGTGSVFTLRLPYRP